MTTQLPYPTQTPAYPTAPPWATPQTAPAGPQDEFPPRPPFGDPQAAHGQLLVAFPEEMQNAARPTPPAWWPVVLWTFFFGWLALFSVHKRVNMARRGRNSEAPYWIAFAVTAAVSVALSTAFYLVGRPALENMQEETRTKLVQEHIVGDGTLAGTSQITATTADCDPIGVRDSAGMRPYDCVLQLDDGRTGTMTVLADTDGKWESLKPVNR